MLLKETSTIYAPVAQVWQTLTDTTVIDHWTTGPSQMAPQVGGNFSIYDDAIRGTNTEVVPLELLRQDWYGGDHPDRKYDVTFMLEPIDDQTTSLTITHDVDEDDFRAMQNTWRDCYFNPIKQLTDNQSTTRARLKLVGKEQLVDNVWSFKFEPSRPMTWTGGQYIWVELVHDHPDAEGARRWFTISSAPYEGIVHITTRISDSTFKQALNALPIGGELELLERPDGDFIWHDPGDTPMVFIAGGIGITAFHSMLKQRVHDDAPIPTTLLYGNRTDHIPFKAELDEWAANHPEFTVRYITGTQMSVQSLLELQPGLTSSLLYISGPEKMVEALGDDFMAHGLPQSRLRLDALPNYTQQNY